MNEWVVLAVLLSLVALRVMAVGILVLFIIRPVRACPACFRDTFPLRKWWLRWITFRMEWRWCPSCGWEGLARRRSLRSGVPSARPTSDPTDPPGPVRPTDQEDSGRPGG